MHMHNMDMDTDMDLIPFVSPRRAASTRWRAAAKIKVKKNGCCWWRWSRGQRVERARANARKSREANKAAA